VAAKAEFEAHLEPVLDRAYALALQLTRNAADAEDLVQEAALLAFRGFATFRRGTNFRAWFLRILTNAYLSSRRRKRPEQDAVSLDETPNAFLQREADRLAHAGGLGGAEPGDVVRSVVTRLETEQIAAAIDALPDEYREVSALYFLQDLPYQEIADMLGIPVGTVRSRLHRGRSLLQRRLWQIALDHGLVPAGTTP
jgi:RNA polymerase sigma-70 factor (ECF subfamily)